MTTKISTANIQASTLATLGANPKISSVTICDSSYVELDDTAIELSGGYIKITGSGFKSGATVTINKTLATSVTFISSTEIRAQVGEQVAGTYVIYVINPDGSVAIRVNGITYSATPAWVTGSSLTGAAEEAISVQLSAPPATAYALQSGSALPTGLTLSSSGLISGTITGLSVETIYNFTVVATDAELQDSPRTFSITVTVGDPYIKYTTTLLSEKPLVSSFNKDSSANNLPITIVGDTKPSNYNPYTPGYYSNYFDGSGDYLTTTTSSNFALSGDFTIEMWVYPTAAIGSFRALIATGGSGSVDQLLIGTDATVAGIWCAGVSSGNSVLPAVGQWSHIAVSRTGTSVYFFLNGVQQGTTKTSSSTALSSSTTLSVGYRAVSADGAFAGYISNLRVIKGTGLYTSGFTPSTTPLTAVSGTSLLTCQANRFIDNSTNAFTITKNGDTKVTSFTPYTPSSSYSTYGSTYFDGTGDWLTVPFSSAFNTGTTYTIEAWVYPTALNSSNFIFNISNNNVASFGGWLLWINASGTVYFECRPSTGGTNVQVIGGTVLLNAWSHIAVSVDSNAVKIFVNGVQVQTGTVVAINGTQTNVGIGALTNGATASAWNGYLADVRLIKGTAVYTTNFTPPTAPLTAVSGTSLLTCQTNQSVNNNVFVDSSTNNLLVTRNGNTTQGTFSPYGENWSNYFDGSGDYLSLSNTTAIGSGSFTMECWVYLTSAPSVNYWIYGYRNGADTSPYFFVTSSRAPVFGGDVTTYLTGSAIALNTWTHIAVVRNGTAMTMYQNGVSTATATSSQNFSYTGTNNIGQANGANAYNYLGNISNFRIVVGTAVYTGAFTPSTTPLTAISGTSLLTCQSPNFADNSPNNFVITKNGDVSVQKFGPFPGTTLPTPYYSAYFDGTGDSLTISASGAGPVGTQDFTVEMWLYATALGGNYPRLFEGTTTGAFQLYLSNGLLTVATNGVAIDATYSIAALTNQWLHLCITRTGTQLRIFVNGVLRAYTNSGGTNYVDSSSWKSSNEGGGIVGYLSNIRVVRGSVVASYQTSSTTTGTSVFTPPTSPLTAISGTSLLTCQSNTFVDNSTNNFTITASGNVTPKQISPFTPTYSTKQSYTPSVFGGSMYFDGTGDYLSLPNAAFNNIITGTIECWVYLTSITEACITAKQQDGLTTQGLLSIGKYASTSGTLTTGTPGVLYWHPTNSSPATANSTSAISANVWTHIAVVFSSTSVTFYINGVASGTTSGNYSLPNNTTPTLSVGQWTADGAQKIGTTGYISNLRIVSGTPLYTSNFVPQNQPLTPVKDTTLLLNGTGGGIYDSSEIINYETVGDARVANFGPYNGSYYSNYFDGSGDYLSLTSSSAFNISGDFTVEGWYNFTALPPSGQNDNLWIFSGATTYNPYLYLWGDGTLVLRTAQTGGTVFTYTHNFSTGVWYHIAVVKSGTTFTLYVNGVSAATGTSSAIISENKSLVIGDSSTYGLQGYLSNFRVVKDTAVYTSNFTPPTSPLTAISGTSLLTCQSNKFVDNSANNFAITRNGDTNVATQNPFQANTGNSMYFDGSGDYLATVNPGSNFKFGTGNWTIEAWMYSTSNSTAQTIYLVYGTTIDMIKIYFNGTTLKPGIDIRATNQTTMVTATSTISANLNSWNHIAVVRDSATAVKLYVNGVLGATATIASTTTFVDTQFAQNPTVGAKTNTVSEYFAGYISDFRITNGIARYTSTFTPPTTSFTTK